MKPRRGNRKPSEDDKREEESEQRKQEEGSREEEQENQNLPAKDTEAGPLGNSTYTLLDNESVRMFVHFR